MTRQEKIREGLANLKLGTCKTAAGKLDIFLGKKQIDKILSYLHSQGVVIKGDCLGVSHPHLADYYSVEPLIKKDV